MERAFQTALWLLRPEVVFILGDIFDEGKWSSPKVCSSAHLNKYHNETLAGLIYSLVIPASLIHQQDWEEDVRRFRRMFRHPSDTELIVLVGNHDIGLHYE